LRLGRLDAVVVSHAHADHVGGLPEVLAAFPPAVLLHAVRPEQAGEEWEEVLETATRLQVPLLQPKAGDRIRVRRSALMVLMSVPPGAGCDW
jgi:competence protein ComEC